MGRKEHEGALERSASRNTWQLGLAVLGHGVAHMAVVHVCLLCHYMPPFFLALGGVIAYISSSSSASSPASCHSESSDSGFQSSSSPVPSSPNSSSSESSCNGRSSEGSDGAPKSDRLEEAVKPSQSGVAGLTKGHNGVTSMSGACLWNYCFPPFTSLRCGTVHSICITSRSSLWLPLTACSKTFSIFFLIIIFVCYMYGTVLPYKC